jgi:hypothetical protein
MNTENKKIEASTALQFLQLHPAINYSNPYNTFVSGIDIQINKRCKRNIPEIYHGVLCINSTDKEWEEIKERFPKNINDDYAYVGYEEFYGEKWEANHITYDLDVNFFTFLGDPYVRFSSHDPNNWDKYSGFSISQATFEDALIEASIKTKELFGDFSTSSFLTEEEKNNHDKISPIDLALDMLKRQSVIQDNPKYLYTTEGLFNLRWLKWFIKTEYCKSTFDKKTPFLNQLTDKLDDMPEARKELLKNYAS